MNVCLLEYEKHRNETTFRPIVQCKDEFYSNGINLTRDFRSADICLVGQASFIDKKLSLNDSVNFGMDFLKSIDKPFVLVDGQDSSSLMGTWDICRNYNNLKIIKNITLSDFNKYSEPFHNGRWFWGKSEVGYSIPIEEISQLKDSIKLSGTNWLNTFGRQIEFPDLSLEREYDVAVLIGLVPDNFEYKIRTDIEYNSPRKKLFHEVSKLKCKVVTTEKTGKLSRDEYFKILRSSKICISPFGFGEVNIREIECLMAGTILIKPDISFVKTKPYIYGEGMSMTCFPDFSDLSDRVEYVLSNWNLIHRNYIERQYETFMLESSPKTFVKNFLESILC